MVLLMGVEVMMVVVVVYVMAVVGGSSGGCDGDVGRGGGSGSGDVCVCGNYGGESDDGVVVSVFMVAVVGDGSRGG